MGKKKLDYETIRDFVKNNPDWVYVDSSLKARFELKSFVLTMKLINRVAQKAEELNHHPSWSNNYNKISFTLTTHEADNCVTSLDIELAKVISREFNKIVG